MSKKRPMTNGEACEKMAELFGRNPEGISGIRINGIDIFDHKKWGHPVYISIERHADGDSDLIFDESGVSKPDK